MDFAFRSPSRKSSLSLVQSFALRFKPFAVFAVLSTLAACGDGESRFPPDLPTDEFAEEYVLADFTLDEDYDYWEIRTKRFFTFDGEDDDSWPESVWKQYDEESYSMLDSVQVEILTDITSDNGLSETIGLMGRSISYAVALQGYSPVVVDSVVDLIEFFDEVDTEAEVWVRLSYTKDYISSTSGYITPLAYEEVSGGYRVLIHWYDGRGMQGRDIVLVSSDGMIKKLAEIERGSGPIFD